VNSKQITLGIKTSCRWKRELYLSSRNSNNPIIKEYYKTYCKILSNVIKEAKRLNYNTQIINLNNTIKTAWEIIKLETGRKVNNDNIHSLIADTFNNYFLSIAENINVNNTHCNTNRHTINNSSLQFMSEMFITPYPNIKR
jgi:hypothetical protein